MKLSMYRQQKEKIMKLKRTLPYLLLAAGTALPLVLSPVKPPSKAPSSGPSAQAVTVEGTAKGMDGDVTVSVTADQDYIYSVEVTDQHETQGIGTIAVDQLPDIIYKNQSWNVDAVSGATITSNAIREGVKAALESAGLTNEKFSEPEVKTTAKAMDRTYKADVVIVGAGGAGMTAAIEAADAGASVMLLESQSMVGGNSIRATGGMNAADTKWQDENEFDEAGGVEQTLEKAASDYADNAAVQELAAAVRDQWEAYQKDPEGYFDSVELMELDTMIGGKGINDPALVKTLAENTADGIDWLDSVGATLHNVGAFGGASVKRIHRPVDDEGKVTAVGAYIVPILEQNIASRDSIRVLYSTTADRILMDKNGAANGIHAVGPSGENVTVKAKAVVLTTGGFGANADMIHEYRPDLDGFMRYT